jgi:hypothetical protein
LLTQFLQFITWLEKSPLCTCNHILVFRSAEAHCLPWVIAFLGLLHSHLSRVPFVISVMFRLPARSKHLRHDASWTLLLPDPRVDLRWHSGGHKAMDAYRMVTTGRRQWCGFVLPYPTTAIILLPSHACKQAHTCLETQVNAWFFVLYSKSGLVSLHIVQTWNLS